MTEDMALVPREATEEVVRAFCDWERIVEREGSADIRDLYRVMLSAAPQKYADLWAAYQELEKAAEYALNPDRIVTQGLFALAPLRQAMARLRDMGITSFTNQRVTHEREGGCERLDVPQGNDAG